MRTLRPNGAKEYAGVSCRATTHLGEGLDSKTHKKQYVFCVCARDVFWTSKSETCPQNATKEARPLSVFPGHFLDLKIADVALKNTKKSINPACPVRFPGLKIADVVVKYLKKSTCSARTRRFLDLKVALLARERIKKSTFSQCPSHASSGPQNRRYRSKPPPKIHLRSIFPRGATRFSLLPAHAAFTGSG